ncbi:hypothetical protein PV416_32790 [Streptomyces ipomoeae]|uniref:hypothetical protein n=1 Tax=Streptomyces ipomoeae TaxID=103232 RepID=UPI00299FCF40|nr:hypothetical protein [Streptomyces ipomoeae]MDX2825722.1 hypothetical protein [Streptomyces ipomoeae]MDX2875650.1 hypothetical protein [Streptomyces ipomoeae]
MIRQARVQAEQGFNQWRRERRQETYAALLSACDAVHDALNTVIGHILAGDPPQDDEQRAEAWRALNGALRGVDRAQRTAAVVGPLDVTNRAADLRRALYAVVSVWRELPRPPADQLAINAANARQAWELAEAHFLTAVWQVTQTFDAD